MAPELADSTKNRLGEQSFAPLKGMRSGRSSMTKNCLNVYSKPKKEQWSNMLHILAHLSKPQASTVLPLYFFPISLMKSVNTVTLLGNVTHIPELKKPAEGQTVCTFGLATNRVWKDAQGDKQTQAEFHNIVAWGKLGELCGEYVKKGKPLYVRGHLKTGTWKNDQGVTMHRTEVVMDDMVLLGSKNHADTEEESVVDEEIVVAA